MHKNPSTLQHSRLSYWALSHCRALLFGMGEMTRTPLSSLMTFIVIGIAMAFPAGLYVFLKDLQGVSQYWNGNPRISLYLKQNVSDGQIKDLENTLRNNPQIAKVDYISPEEGLAQFARKTQLGNLVNSLPSNPLPGVIMVTPTQELQSPDALETLLKQLNTISLVSVGHLDMQWVKRLFYVVTLGKRVTYALTFLFGLGVIIIVGNTIGLAMQEHQQEINVLKLVGATQAFIRRPLLYRGMLFGFVGGIFACCFDAAMVSWLSGPARALINSYQASLQTPGLGIGVGFGIVLICTLLGFLGAWATVQRHLYSKESS